MIASRTRTLALPVLAGLLVPSSLLGTTVAIAASARNAPSHRRAHHARRNHGGIPQHNGGDRDSDNNGAPSDGDGNQ